MFITGIGTAVPPRRYTQLQCWDAFQTSPQFELLAPRSRAILKKVLTGQNGIATRHLALDSLAHAFDLTPDVLHERFLRNAPVLAAEAAANAMARAGLDRDEVDAIVISTCTGYLCPGLTSYVAERLNLRADVCGLDLVGQGCGAAIPNMRAGEALIASGRAKHVLSVCVEVCSAAFYLDDDPGVLISAALFGDGAGALVLSAEPRESGRVVQWVAASSLNSAIDRDLLRFEQKGGLLRNILSPQVPGLAAGYAEAVLNETLRRANVPRGEIRSWIFHAGGRDVLIALQEKLQLDSEQLCWSARILREFGNLSSPFVYFVLQAALEEKAPDGLWWMGSFGAGFSSHGTLLRVGEGL